MLIHEGDLKWIKVYEHKLFNISGGKEGEQAQKKYEFLQN